jgi:hypothetical protein
MSPTTVKWGRPGLLLALGLTLIVVAACGSGSSVFGPAGGQVANPVPAGGQDQARGAAMPPTTGGSNQTGGSGLTDQSGANLYDVSRPDLLIIKTGSLSLQVAAIDDALAGAAAKIAALGGYASGSDIEGDGEGQTATVTYRIPAAQWDAALVALRGMAIKVLGENSQTQDVTGDVLDLGARIRNLQATELALQGIMTKATKISDVLDVQQQLTQVRGQIEELTTQKQHLEGQAAYSTLTTTFSLKPEAAVVASQKQFDPNDEVDKASASLVAVLQALATAGIWFGIVWLPILLVLAIVGALVFLVARRLRRDRVGPASILPTATEG